jgi:Domain of unknown function DUF11/Putative peptidoglycan binding domain
MVFLNNRKSFLIAVSGAWCLLSIATAHAAPLNFATAESVTLSSPTTTLTIATGSVADALQINATSVLVTLSQTTGGSFVILSPSYDLAVATSSGGGSTTLSCSGGVETATLSQSTGSAVYTVTPSGTTCANTAPPVITNITATNIATNSATITWTTNIAADSTVSYGTTISYGSTSTDPTLVTSHSINLANLDAGTLYHYAVSSADYGTSTTSGDNTFTTAGIASGGGGIVTVGGGGSPVADVGVSEAVDEQHPEAGSQIHVALTALALGPSASPEVTVEDALPPGLTFVSTVSTMGTFAPDTGQWTVGTLQPNTSATLVLTLLAGATTTPGQVITNTATVTENGAVDSNSSNNTATQLITVGGGGIANTTSTTAGTSTLALQAEIAVLEDELQSLMAQAGNVSSSYHFTRNLGLWDTGPDVHTLQGLLVSENAGPAARALAMHGTTQTFGYLTLNALKEFQAHVGISATGYFGPITRAYVPSL